MSVAARGGQAGRRTLNDVAARDSVCLWTHRARHS